MKPLLFDFFFFLVVLGFELRALALLGRDSYHLNHAPSHETPSL
jgi:hypothetical protein